MARLNAKWDDFLNRGQIWDHFWQDTSLVTSATYSQIGQAQAFIFIPVATHVASGNAQANILQAYIFSAQSQAIILVTENTFAQSQVNILTTYQGYAQGLASLKTVYNTFGQSQTGIKAESYNFGQVNSYIKIVGLNVTAQAEAAIKTNYEIFAQAQTQIILSEQQSYAQTQTSILLTPAVCGQAQASIRAVYDASGQALALVQAVGYGLANSQVWIQTISFAYSNSQSTVLQTYLSNAQAQAHILITDYVYAQANSQIILTNYAVGNSIAQILSTPYAEGQAQADILTTYQAYSQAESQITIPGEIIEYQAFAQVNSQIIHTYYAIGNSLSQILTTYSETGQSQSQILTSYFAQSQAGFWASLSDGNLYNQGYANAQTEIIHLEFAQAQTWLVYRNGEAYIWPQFGNSLAHVLVQDNQVYGQALAWIALTEIVTLFYDSFTRTTTAPPFNVGTSDSGHTWYWTSDDSSYTESTSPTHVENGMLVGPSNQKFDSMAGFPHITKGEFWIDFWMPAANDNAFEWKWYDFGWYVGIDVDTNSTMTLDGRNTSINNIPIITRSAWYRVYAVIDLDATNKVQAAVWKVGDSEPALQTIQTTSATYDSYFDIYYSPLYEAARFDNIIIVASGPMPYNLGRGQAQARILTTYQQYAQSQVILNQSRWVAQAQTNILTNYQKYAQARVRILKSAGYANAQTKIAWPADSYRDMVYADGATHFYGMRTLNAYPNSDYSYFKDELGTQNSNAPYYAIYSTTIASPIGPEYLGVSLGRTNAYRGWSSDLSPSTSKILEFVTSTWSYDGWVKAPSTSPALASVFGLYLQTSYHYFDIYFGGITNEDTAGTQIVIMAYENGGSMTYYDTGVTFVPGAWYHIAVTYNNKVFKIYINNILTNTITRSAWNPTGTSNIFYLGYSYYYGAGTTYVGGYDSLAIYPITLDQEVITKHFIDGLNTKFTYAQAQSKLNSFDWNEYGQAQTTINQSQYVAQAEAYLRSFDWNEYGQAQAKVIYSGLTTYAQANVYILPRCGFGLTQAQILQTYPRDTSSLSSSLIPVILADTPAAYWPLDDTQTSVVRELVDNKWATLTGSGTISPTTNVEQYPLVGWRWSAGNGYYLSSNFTQPATDIAIVEAWFATSSASPGEIWQGRYGDTESTGKGITLTLNGVGFGTITGRLNFIINSDNIWYGVSTNTAYNDGNLHHVVAAWRRDGALDNSEFKIYVDGVQVSTYNNSTTGSLNASLAGATPGCFLGRSYGSFDGFISHIAFYTHDLTNTQIASHYTIGTLTKPFAQALAYIGHFQSANANAKIQVEAIQGYAQVQTQIGGFQYGLAITQIINEVDKYRLAVLADRPMFYYPMDEVAFNPTNAPNLVRFPTSGSASYSAYNIYSATYAEAKAADGVTSDGWASAGYTPGEWWQVDWTVPQTFKAVRVIARPGNDYFGQGYIELSSGVRLDVVYPPAPNKVSVYLIDATNVTWMRLVSTSGGISNPGFSEVEAYDDSDIGILRSIVGRRNAVWDSSGATFEQSPALLSGTSIDFNNKAATVSTPYYGESLLPIANGTAITVEGWFKWDGANENMIFGFDTNDLFVYGASAETAYIGFNDGAGHQYGTATRDIVSGKWYHFAAVFYSGQPASTSNKLFIDGVQKSLSGASLDTRYASQNFVIGGWLSNASYQWESFLDEIAIYNYELTAGQVLTHYRARIILWNAQAQARIIGFGYQRYAQAQVQLGAFWPAQAQARILHYDYNKSAQATALITHNGEGLVRMVWTGEYTPYPQNIIAWAIEDTSNQIYYSSGGTTIPGYPGSNAGVSWSARFIADATGTWQFRTTSDDNSEVSIDFTVVVANYSTSFLEGGHSSTTREGSIALVQDTEYNLHIRFTQGGGPWNIYVYYKRPTDSSWILLTNNKPPWLLAPKVRVHGQAQAEIFPQPHMYAHAQAQVCIQGRVYGQAQALIGHLQHAQAQAKLNAFDVNIFGQALAFIGHLQSGNAQAKLNAFNVNRYAQAQAFIRKSAGYANAQTWIKATCYGFGQAQCWYLPSSEVGSAQGTIKQTYPLMSMDTNYALTTMGATASDSDSSATPINVIDGQDLGPIWEMMGARGHLEGEVWVPDDEWIQIDLGANRTINFYRILPFKYNGTKVTLQYYQPQHFQPDWHDVDIDIVFSVDYFDYEVDASKAITKEITPITARIWRLLVTDLGDWGGIALATFELGWATVKSPTFAQAQAAFGHFGIGQSKVFIWPAYDVNANGQSQASIISTYQKYSQAGAWILPPTVTGLALADILQTYNQYGLANTWVIPPTVIANAQAQIIGFDIPHFGQAKADILQVYSRVAQAQTQITKFAGFGLALASIKSSYRSKVYGNARVVIGHWQFGLAMAYIIKSWAFGQATVDIVEIIGQFAQARVFMRVPPSGQAKAQIKQTYVAIGLAGALLNTGFGLANAGSTIEQVYRFTGQAQADIEQTYSRVAQAQTIIHITHKESGQARVVIATQALAIGQAMVWIGYHKFSQAQARLIAFGVPKFGLAGGYIIVVGVQPPPINPSSDYYTYLVRFNGYNLPGYAQSESFGGSLSIASNNAPYMDASLSEDIGLKNVDITIEMLLWEETYQKCKDKLSIAGTILRISKDFAPLYIQRYDRYYMAIAKSISASKSVPESPRTLRYTVEFEAKPWQMNIDGTSTAPVPEPIVIPPELLPPPVIPPSPSTIYREAFGLSKAKIISFQTIRTGLAQVKITRTEGYGLSQAFIKKSAGFAQARTRIRGTYRANAQAQAKIVRKQGYGQARVFIATLPGAPTNLVATPGDTRVTLSWSPPAYG